MLKNPSHLFRQDGTKISLPLFDAIKLPRANTQLLNEAVASRHLKLNGIEADTNTLMKNVFWNKHNADVRMEHDTVRPYRYNVLPQGYLTGHIPSVARTQINKRVRFIANKVLPIRCSPESDLIFLCKEGSYFAPLEEIERQMIAGLYFLNSLNKRLEEEYDEETFSRFYWKSYYFNEEEKHKYYAEVLLLSYRENTNLLLNQLSIMSKHLKDPDSELSLICYPTEKKHKIMISNRTIAIKRWSRDKKFDSILYRCLGIMGWLNSLELVLPIINYINNPQ
jgi:hypothetical protein